MKGTVQYALYLFILVAALGLAGYFALCALVVARATFRIHSTQTFPVVQKRTETNIDQLSEEMRQFISTALAQLGPLGFEVIANEYLPAAAPNVTAVQILLVQPVEKHTAAITAVRAKGERTLNINFASTFEDGFRLLTGSHKTRGSAPSNPMDDICSFPWLTDCTLIYEAHRRRLVQSNRHLLPRIVPSEATATEWLVARWQRDMSNLSRHGRLWRDERAGVYRWTWKGAILGALGNLPLVARRRSRIAEIRARRIWQDLKMEEVAPSPSSVADEKVPASNSMPVAPLDFAASLSPGEIRKVQSGATVIIQIGGVTRRQFLRKASLPLVLMAVILSLFALVMLGLARILTAAPKGGLGMPLICWFGIVFFVVLSAPSLARLLRRFLTSRGTITLSANHEGLDFRDAGGNWSGHIAREEIRSLILTRVGGRRGRILGRLTVMRFAPHKRQVLVYAGRLVALDEVRKDLLGAMGMNVVVVPPPLPARAG